jgi:hypothetical protein
MTDDDRAPIERDDQLDALVGLLAHAELWEDPPPGVEDAVVAEIRAAAATSAHGGSQRSLQGRPPNRDGRWTRRGRLAAVVATAAAVLALGILAGVLLVDGGADDGGVVVALAGTELAPDASATADIESTPLGVKILLDVRDLPGAPPGTYYEAWLRTPTDGVSAGTFHLRGGGGRIELWCGVDAPAYSTITVTLQEEGGGAASSGRVVLRGEL